MCAYASAVVAIEVEFSNQDSALNPNIKKQQMLVDALSTYSCVSAYSHSFSMCVGAHICNHPTYGLVVDRMNMELNGGMGLGPPSPPFSSSSSSLSSFVGKGSVLAFLFTTF